MLTFAQLTRARTKEEHRALLYQALRGIGYVRATGIGSGSLAAYGVALGDYSAVVEITVSGDLGSAKFRWSSDGGTTWSAAATVPATPVAIGATGAAVLFSDGPDGAEDSFAAGDRFAFQIAIPTLPVTAWQPFSTGPAFVDLNAQANEELDALLVQLGESGFVETAKGSWLDLVCSSLFDEERKPAVSAQHTFRLTDSGEGPHTISAAQLWVVNASGLRFTNPAGGTLTLGGTLDLTFEAERPGSAYNIGVGSQLALETTIAGVTVTNPAVADGSSITRQGADRESDEELKARAPKKWGTLGPAANEDGYEAWALRSSPTITRVRVFEDEETPGLVNVIVAGDGGSAGCDDAAAQAYINPRVPMCSLALVAKATEVPVTVAGTVWVKAASRVPAQEKAEVGLVAFFNALDIGGEKKSVAADGVVSLQKIGGLLTSPFGVIDADLTAPLADVALADDEVAVLTLSLTWVEV